MPFLCKIQANTSTNIFSQTPGPFDVGNASNPFLTQPGSLTQSIIPSPFSSSLFPPSNPYQTPLSIYSSSPTKLSPRDDTSGAQQTYYAQTILTATERGTHAREVALANDYWGKYIQQSPNRTQPLTKETRQLLRMASMHGHSEASHLLATSACNDMESQGPDKAAQNREKAVKYIERAVTQTNGNTGNYQATIDTIISKIAPVAAGGSHLAQGQMSKLYLCKGDTESKKKAEEFYQGAQKEPRTLSEFGDMYLKGTLLEYDATKADGCLKSATMGKGDAHGHYIAGRELISGKLLVQNIAQGVAHMSIGIYTSLPYFNV